MKKQLFITSLAATLLLAGCVVAPAPYYDEPIFVEPPPPRVEYPGYAPVTGYIWIGGYWNWTGHRHEWVPGRWDAPRHGHRWVAPRWERDGNRWRQHRGGWEQETDTPTLHPVFKGAPPAPRYERHDERRPDPGPGYRQERGSVPPPVRAEPPRRDNEARPGPDAGRSPREVRPAPTPRVDQDNRGRDKHRDDRRSGRRGPDDDR